MTLTKGELIGMLSKKSGYYKKDIDALLKSYEDLIVELMSEVSMEEDISLQILQGIKVGCKVVPERDRVDPRTRELIKVKDTVKPFTIWTKDFRQSIQKPYDEKYLKGE